MIPPLAKGIGWSLIPRPQRYYFSVGKRISTRALAGKAGDTDVVWKLRERVAGAITRQISTLTEHRKTDRTADWSGLRRWLAPI